jgi:hypothetical protein
MARVPTEIALLLDFWDPEGQVSISGSPAQLRAAAAAMRDTRSEIEIAFASEAVSPLRALVVRRIPGSTLRVSVAVPYVYVDCDPEEIDESFICILDTVAEEAERAPSTRVSPHHHVEYNDAYTDWIAADSLPLIIGSDRH